MPSRIVELLRIAEAHLVDIIVVAFADIWVALVVFADVIVRLNYGTRGGLCFRESMHFWVVQCWCCQRSFILWGCVFGIAL